MEQNHAARRRWSFILSLTLPMADRYYVNKPITGPTALLDGPEAHHLVHVLRAKAGSIVSLFDGSGAEFSARIESIGRTDVRLAILSRHAVDRELPFEVTIGVSLPKGERQRWLVEKATELGVTRLAPLLTHRGIALPTDAAILRLQRTVVEASKQCGRNRLMQIESPASAGDFFRSAPANARRWIAHPEAASQSSGHSFTQPIASAVAGDRYMFAVGPEGGFTDDEFQIATGSGWIPMNLGPRILRVETAAIALAAWASQGRLGGPA